jgi:hypothetical protein
MERHIMHDVIKMNIHELKQKCIDQKIVSKNLKLNPRKDRSADLCVQISEFFEAPLHVAIDILFAHDGVVPTCKHCCKKLDLMGLSNYRPISYSHVECSKLNRNSKIDWNASIKKRKSTCLEKYGVEDFFDYDAMITKSRQTKLEKYGDENYVNAKKSRQTKLEKYGDENYRNDEQIKITCLERYGSENPFGSSSIIQKTTQILEDRYGGRGWKSSVISETIRNTNLEKYGVDNAMCNGDISKKSRDTRRKKYFGEDVYAQLTTNLSEIYSKYVDDNSLSISKLSEDLGLDRNTLSRSFIREGFAILDRKYSCSTSAGEDYLHKILMDIKPDLNVVRNTRDVIPPKEIDLWIPEYNLGIEYHGSYWHSEDRVNNLHYQKAALAKERGIRLIQIFDFELIESLEEIKNILKASLHVFDHKLAARDCEVVTLNTNDARLFCEKNHLQGYAAAKMNYGLLHKQFGLVQLLSFGKPRFSKKYQWEIIRSCSKSGHIVMGGLEKLWSRFIRDNEVMNVITYSDARFFTGESYTKLGFVYHNHSNSGYVWSNGVQRVSRYKTQRRKLIENCNDINITESQLMKNKGFHKILDAGNHVYIATLKI